LAASLHGASMAFHEEKGAANGVNDQRMMTRTKRVYLWMTTNIKSSGMAWRVNVATAATTAGGLVQWRRKLSPSGATHGQAQRRGTVAACGGKVHILSAAIYHPERRGRLVPGMTVTILA